VTGITTGLVIYAGRLGMKVGIVGHWVVGTVEISVAGTVTMLLAGTVDGTAVYGTMITLG
jgi:hypothetical protein